MNVRELIEWLQTQPQEAIVEVLQHTSVSGYYDQGGNCTTVAFEAKSAQVGENYVISDFFDLYTYKDKTVLQLGMMNV